MVLQPEQEARETIDKLLAQAGWVVCDADQANIHAAHGVAIREFPLKPGHGFADYLLYVNGKAAGVIEAKPEGATLTGVEIQSAKYSTGLPENLPAWGRPLPFSYQSTGTETRFTNGLDPAPRSRPVFAFHKPETLAAWLDDARITPSPLAGGEAETGKGPVDLFPAERVQMILLRPGGNNGVRGSCSVLSHRFPLKKGDYPPSLVANTRF